MDDSLTVCITLECKNSVSHADFKEEPDTLLFHHRLYDLGWRYDAQHGGWRCPEDRGKQFQYPKNPPIYGN